MTLQTHGTSISDIEITNISIHGIWLYLNPPPTFLEPGGDGCELRVASCEVKNIGAVFLPRFFKILPHSPATRNPQQILILF
jgi:hypothetical protein